MLFFEFLQLSLYFTYSVRKADDLHKHRPADNRSAHATYKGQNSLWERHILTRLPYSLAYEKRKENAAYQPHPSDDNQQLFNLCSLHLVIEKIPRNDDLF